MLKKGLIAINRKSKLRGLHSIAFVSHSSLLEGAERALLDYIDVLLANGYSCYVFIPRDGPLEEELDKRSVPYSIVSLPSWDKRKGLKSRDIEIEIYTSLPQVLDELIRLDPHIVFTNSSVINIGAVAALILNKPHIWSVHEFGLKEYGIEFQQTLEERCRFMSTSSEKLIFSSKTLKDYYAKYLPRDKVEVLYQSVNLPARSCRREDDFINQKSLKLLILGSIFSGKRQEDAIRALKILQKKNLPVELLIVGNSIPEYKKYLLKLVSNFNLRNVKILDFVSNPRSIIESCDVLVNCSPKESLGRVVVEAMSLGKAVIGAKSGGILELVQDRKTGLLFKPKDPHDLAEKIEYLYRHRRKLLELGVRARSFIKKKFTRKSFNKKLLSIIDEIVLSSTKYTQSDSNSEGVRAIFTSCCELIGQEKECLENTENKLESIKKSYWYRVMKSKKWYIYYPRKVISFFLKLFKGVIFS